MTLNGVSGFTALPCERHPRPMRLNEATSAQREPKTNHHSAAWYGGNDLQQNSSGQFADQYILQTCGCILCPEDMAGVPISTESDICLRFLHQIVWPRWAMHLRRMAHMGNLNRRSGS